MFKVFYINFNLYILLIILQTVAMHVSRRVNCDKVYVSAQIKIKESIYIYIYMSRNLKE